MSRNGSWRPASRPGGVGCVCAYRMCPPRWAASSNATLNNRWCVLFCVCVRACVPGPCRPLRPLIDGVTTRLWRRDPGSITHAALAITYRPHTYRRPVTGRSAFKWGHTQHNTTQFVATCVKQNRKSSKKCTHAQKQTSTRTRNETATGATVAPLSVGVIDEKRKRGISLHAHGPGTLRSARTPVRPRFTARERMVNERVSDDVGDGDAGCRTHLGKPSAHGTEERNNYIRPLWRRDREHTHMDARVLAHTHARTPMQTYIMGSR